MTVPTPPELPPIISWMVWAAVIVSAILAGGWRGFVWLIERIKYVFGEAIRSEEFRKVIDERFEVAIESRAFKAVVDERVSQAFDGAMGPLMAADRSLAADVGKADAKASKAHERIDDLEESLADHIEECSKKGAAA